MAAPPTVPKYPRVRKEVSSHPPPTIFERWGLLSLRLGAAPSTGMECDDGSSSRATPVEGVGLGLALVAVSYSRSTRTSPFGQRRLDQVEAAGGLLQAIPGESGVDIEKVNAAVRAAIDADLDFSVAPWLRLGV